MANVGKGGGGVVEAIWGAAVWSKSSGKVRVFLSTTGEKWSISDSIMVLQSFGGEPVPVEHSLALQAELASRAGKQLGGRGLKRAHDEPAEPRATPAPTPTRKAPKGPRSAKLNRWRPLPSMVHCPEFMS